MRFVPTLDAMHALGTLLVRYLRALALACTLITSWCVLLVGGAAAATPTKLVVSGTATEGSTLVVKAPKGARLSWLRCGGSRARCVTIRAATKPRYVVVAADVGSVLRVALGTGRRQVRSKPTARIRPEAPALVETPKITGTGAVGATLTTTPGVWTARGRSLAFSYQWLRCTGSTCAPIVDASNASYAPVPGDVGASLRVDVAARSTLRGLSPDASARSAAAVDVWMPHVVNSVVPTITGTMREGATLHAGRGTWSAGDLPVTTTIAWVRCGTSCSAIPGATGDDYVLTATDVGSQVRIDVTGVAGPANLAASSRATARIEAVTPVSVSLPTTAPGSVPGIGDTITTTDGTWTTLAPTTYSYQWQRCTTPGVPSCSDIPDAIARTYVTVAADAGLTLRVRVAAHHLSTVAIAVSGTTQVVTGVGPASAGAQVVTGQAVRGEVLTAGDGSFTGPGMITTTGQWQRCDAAGGACVDVAGATASTYLLDVPDVGSTLVYVVTATNPWGTTAHSSVPTAVVVVPDPANTTAPAVGGTLYDGGTASVSTGAWAGLTPMSFSYQWQRCDASGGNCADIVGAASQTYAPGTLDVTNTLRVVVTATNAAHAVSDTSVTSAASAPVGSSPVPARVTAPTITGTVRDGATLTWHAGTYTGQLPMTLVRQWQRCSAGGASCVDIGGAIGSTIVLGAADVGSTIRVREQATNTAGVSGYGSSSVTQTVAPAPPVNGSVPTVTGTTMDGATLSATTGAWSGSPTMTYAFQWRRCNTSGAACIDIGAGAATYVLTSADVSGTVRVVVTATNAAGPGAPATSAATPSIAVAPPVASTPLPSISGVFVRNDTLSTTPGAFTGTAPFTYSYQWWRCDAAGASCVDVAGATSATYLLAVADVGKTMRSRVTAHSGQLSATATVTSPPTPVIATALVAPSEAEQVTITGGAFEHGSLTVVPATFAGTAPIAHAYQWKRCDGLGLNCSDVTDTSDSSGATWLLDAADVGSTLVVVDTATNGAGSATSTSDATDVVIATVPALVTSPPAIVGQLEEGAVITADPGSWDGAPAPTFAYTWLRCDVAGTSCAPISGATDATYALVAADVGRAVMVRVVGSNAFGSDSSASPVSSEVAPARRPVNSGGLPTVTTLSLVGIPETKQDLTATDGTWTGTEAVHTYQWLRCDSVGGACVPVAGATSAVYTLVHPSDAGHTFRVAVRYTNVAGTDVATSPATFVAIPGTPPSTNDVPDVSRGAQGVIDLTTPPVWGGTATIGLEYEWMMCLDPADDAQCTTYVPRDAGSSFTMTSSDFQNAPSWLRLKVWASNAFAPAGVESALSNPISVPHFCGGCPMTCLCSNLTPPTITGDAVEPGTLTGDDGTWSTMLPLTMLHQWFRCDAAGATCTAITGAVDSTYDLVPADVGSTVKFRVIGSGEFGDSAPEWSDPTGVVVAATPPVNSVPPAITGVDRVIGTTLSVSDGTWTGLPSAFTYEYQWERCDAAGATCTDIDNETSSSYTMVQADLGQTVRARVTATNVAGFGTVEADAYPSSPDTIEHAADPVAPAAADLVITDDTDATPAPFEGHALSIAAGQWGGTAPVAFGYQWQLCDASGGACVDLAGETATTHVVTHDDIGHTFRVVVAGSNPSPNVVTVTSDAYPGAGVVLAAVQPILDAGGPPITIDDAPERTKPSTADAGTWLGTKPFVVTQQWQRCADRTPATCEDITGETSTSYTPTVVDVNEGQQPYYLRLVVTATNIAGATVEAGPISADPVLPGVAPANTTQPSISGSLLTGDDLTAYPGAWSGTVDVQYTYQWRQCDSSGASCHDVLGATDATYVPVAADEGLTIAVEVTGHNLVGVSVPATSASVGPITP